MPNFRIYFDALQQNGRKKNAELFGCFIRKV